jgi:hypothetical protein
LDPGSGYLFLRGFGNPALRVLKRTGIHVAGKRFDADSADIPIAKRTSARDPRQKCQLEQNVAA